MPEFDTNARYVITSAGVPQHETLQQAAEWFAVLNDESATEQDRVQWVNWVSQHPQHKTAWHFVEKVGQRFQVAQQAGQGDVSKTLNAARTDRMTRRRMLQGTGALCVLGLLSWRFTTVWRADYHTAIGEIQKVALQDGGQVWLNTASGINVQYQFDVRQITLVAGEVLIQTAADPQQRPFLIKTLQGRMRALGTRFTVRQQDTDTFLAVYEGAVEISTVEGKVKIIQAGQQTTFTEHNIQLATDADRAREVWVQGLIIANNISLLEFSTEVNRYRYGHLSVDPAIEGLRVMGTYPVNQIDHVLTMLEKALPVKVRRILPWWVTLEESE